MEKEKEKEGLKCKGYECKEVARCGFGYCCNGLRLLLIREQLSFITPCGFEVRLYVKRKT